MKVTLGGDRLGSGKKMIGRIHNYFRSTHNLSEKFASSLAPGVLYPCLVKPAMRGDSFDITIDADARTIPTKGPLFGAFKMQLDIFQVPIRLYQGILHNNPVDIGLNMGQVKFPQMIVKDYFYTGDKNEGKFNDSCLLKYLGMSGLGTLNNHTNAASLGRYINAIPMLAYYDIFKTYYANKQEENAYVISRTKQYTDVAALNAYTATRMESENNEIYRRELTNPNETKADEANNITIPLGEWSTQTQTLPYFTKNYFIRFNTPDIKKALYNVIEADESTTIFKFSIGESSIDITIEDLITSNYYGQSVDDYSYNINWYFINDTIKLQIKIEINSVGATFPMQYSIQFAESEFGFTSYKDVDIQQFTLKNIDKMRQALLCKNEMGSVFKIGTDISDDWTPTSGADSTGLPYSCNVNVDELYYSLNRAPMNGLVLKTYQNDIFNNWLNTTWIEGENGINELTKVTVTDGKFSMDALNFAEKLYNMLNRIAVAGATYEAWQDVVYEQVKRKQIESPIYCGGMSREIMFDEVLQTTPTADKPLGTIGGRGRLIGSTNKGGKVHIKCDEASFIIGIVSLTPRIFYTQGNEFYMTDLISMDDFHKPEMDGIGFQDLIGERMAYFDTRIAPNALTPSLRTKIGKLPAWIEYMTSVDRAYADFAKDNGAGFMILNRNYEKANNGGIKDATTYVDPQKYNYAFADTTLTAQNFWFEAAFKITARRLMSARIIPNV